MSLLRYIMKKAWKGLEKSDADRIGKQPPVPGSRMESCIPYAADMHPMHQLNLYYPQGYCADTDGKLPVIIDIHGGGLMYGDKELNQRYCEYLASQRFCVMGMSYRLLPDTDLQGMVQDVFESIHWLEHYGEKRGFDLENVFLTGDSAGGHLASLVMCIQYSERLQQIYGVKPFAFDFKAVAISNGVCEIQNYFSYSKALNQRIDRELVSMILGKAGEQAAWRSYFNFSQALAEVETIPPVLVIGAENDSFYHHTLKLLENLGKREYAMEKLIWGKEAGPHLGHVFQVSHWEWLESRETNNKMLEFFRGHMK